MIGALVLVGTLAVATAVGLLLRSRNGRMRQTPTGRTGALDDAAGLVSGGAGPQIDLGPFGAEPGSRATLVQFSSTFCAPCRATRAMLGEVADGEPGVRHVEIDVADGDAALDLVRRLDIRRTPTTLVLDARGQERGRASGVPRRDQVLAALAEL